MLEFAGVCYLDTPKTGSTFIRDFLTRHIDGKPLRGHKHRRLGYFHDRSKFHFSSCRDPLDQYASLYRFGCEGKGAFFAHQRMHGTKLLETYGELGGFEAWLEMILDGPIDSYLSRRAAAMFLPGLGLMSNRFMLLNLRGFANPLLRPRSDVGLRRALRTRYIPDAVVKTETLNADLLALVEGPLLPHLRKPAQARKLLADGARRVNTTAGETGRSGISGALLARLEAAEWPHYEILGYPSRQ
ncbi:hypothetical protein [Algicella marina]|uniref:Sulfotransferase family protein n=1 Tax=Algicella marina TaxID=2683284 RepID=A0A6P1T0J9_9RHOB|nr:hypothetical protein [Algicella marina]QHQ36258.1 hypothetical protein GO499_14300 [Algicella marina]